MKYYSDRVGTPAARTSDTIGASVWAGVVAQIQAQVASGGLAQRFPELCPDGALPVAANEKMLAAALQAEVPATSWPLETMQLSDDKFTYDSWAPETSVALDVIEFFSKSISKAIQGSYHPYFKHYHLTFDVEQGKAEFRESMNLIFERNGLAFELNEAGMIERLLNPILAEALQTTTFHTADATLNGMLDESVAKIRNPRAHILKEALERLWDAWERLKSIRDADKKISTKILLDMASAEPNFREILEQDARQMTDVGNKFQIRHTETDKIPISDKDQIDYLFHRLFGLIAMILAKTG